MSFEKPGSIENQESPGIEETKVYPLVNQRLQNRYDRIAPVWNSEAYKGTRRDDLMPKLISLLSVEASKLRVLEAMSGTALLGEKLKATNPLLDVYALDFSRGMLNQVPEFIRTIQSSVIAMPFADKAFPRIALRNSLFDLPKRLQQKALEEIRRVLTDDGVFVLQHYHTTSETFECLNELVKRKDIAANQNEDMGKERFPRYFAPIEEFEKWLDKAGFLFSKEEAFDGEIRYMKTTEMVDVNLWVEYAQSIPEEIKNLIKLRTETDGTMTFNFPGVIYKIEKK
jgi:ubiquinone/menaquinone biosynthesis C-methylase UbiE